MKKLIGYGYTNSSGVATLDYDTDDDEIDGYTGTGAGVMNFRAEMHDDSTVVSQPYTVWDTKWFDLGTDSTNNIFNSSSTMDINYGDEYATMTEHTSGTDGVLVTNNTHYIQPNDVFEFDFMQVDGTTNYSPIYIRNSGNGASLSYFSLSQISKSVNTWIHLKCQIVGNVLNIYVDGATTPITRPMSNTDNNYRLYFTTSNTITELRYKNLKVYPSSS